MHFDKEHLHSLFHDINSFKITVMGNPSLQNTNEEEKKFQYSPNYTLG